jgi:glycosyltransferase 2 family protein
MARSRSVLKLLVSLLIVACAGFFFFKAFQRNWASVRAHEFLIDPAFLAGSLLAAVVPCLLATFGWYTAMNSLSRSKISFRQSIAAVNASSLTKYIPGKVWSYALQMYWLDGLGFSKALIVYVNLVNLLISMAASVMLGLLCLLFSSSSFPFQLVLAVLLGLFFLDACSVIFSRAILNRLISLINSIFRRDFSYFEVKRSLLVKLHLIHLGAAVTSGLGVYLFCFAIGYRVDSSRALLVIASSLLSEVVGFLAIVVPGGLGVRESLMYAMLGGEATGSLSLVLPVASRMMNMLVDVLLGVVALRLLQTLAARQRSEDGSGLAKSIDPAS